jgi:prepilin-type N-terminal cleavage/methylation domain-containing protein
MSKKGFSLIELMVVVAIIGILAMIAIPSYQGFVAKARQKEGINLLNSFFTAAHSTRAEFGHFPGNLVQTGFQPVGVLNYRFRSEDGRDINIPINDNDCYRTFQPCNCGGACPQFKTWQEMPPGDMNRLGAGSVEGPGCSWSLSTQDNSFVIGVAGWIQIGATSVDRIFMNERGEVQICADGRL